MSVFLVLFSTLPPWNTQKFAMLPHFLQHLENTANTVIMAKIDLIYLKNTTFLKWKFEKLLLLQLLGAVLSIRI